MVGGHASSRVDSGSMRFRPGLASSRRANHPSTPSRPLATQTSSNDSQLAPGPSTSQNPQKSQTESAPPNVAAYLPTPPVTQAVSNFPLDPTLVDLADPSTIIPSAPDMMLSSDGQDLTFGPPTDAGVDPQMVVPQIIPLIGEMPPPPPLHPEAAPPNLNLNLSEVEDQHGVEAEPPVVPKKRKIKRKGVDAGANGTKPKRKRKTERSQTELDKQTDDDREDVENEAPKRKRGRKANTAAKKAATVEDRISALEKHAAEVIEEGALAEPLDPINATMASLCENDLPSGRVSSKFLEKGIAYVKHVEERRKRIMERTAERLKRLRTSGLDPDDPQQLPPVKKPEPEPTPTTDSVAGPSNSTIRELGASLSPSPEPAEPAETFAESAAAPQIRFVNGEMVLDEESQFYDRGAPTQQDEDAMVVVDEADSTRFSNSASFARREGAKGARWSADETEMFYWCLSTFGEDYENIARYLGRTPGQCKNKTKAEDRKGNEKRITMAIKTRIPLDLEDFGRITGRDFSGPPPEIRAPTAPLPSIEEQQERQEPAMVGAKVKASSSAPSTPRKKGKVPARDGEEEIMTLEEYELDGKDD